MNNFLNYKKRASCVELYLVASSVQCPHDLRIFQTSPCTPNQAAPRGPDASGSNFSRQKSSRKGNIHSKVSVLVTTDNVSWTVGDGKLRKKNKSWKLTESWQSIFHCCCCNTLVSLNQHQSNCKCGGQQLNYSRQLSASGSTQVLHLKPGQIRGKKQTAAQAKKLLKVKKPQIRKSWKHSG